jgi:hypothetical protein
MGRANRTVRILPWAARLQSNRLRDPTATSLVWGKNKSCHLRMEFRPWADPARRRFSNWHSPSAVEGERHG